MHDCHNTFKAVQNLENTQMEKCGFNAPNFGLVLHFAILNYWVDTGALYCKNTVLLQLLPCLKKDLDI